MPQTKQGKLKWAEWKMKLKPAQNISYLLPQIINQSDRPVKLEQENVCPSCWPEEISTVLRRPNSKWKYSITQSDR